MTSCGRWRASGSNGTARSGSNPPETKCIAPHSYPHLWGVLLPLWVFAQGLVQHTVYPGTCREGLAAGAEGHMQRSDWKKGPWRGTMSSSASSHFRQIRWGFPLLRADGYWAYPLAVVVDDRSQGVTHVIRGADRCTRQMRVWEALSQVTDPFRAPGMAICRF